MKAKAPLTGSCLCERVRYEIRDSLRSADHCHCSMYRKQHGAAFASYAEVDSNNFKWIKGGALIKTHEIKSGAGWCFCSECDSSLAGTQNGKLTSVALATIEGDIDIKPKSHIFVNSKANWHQIGDKLTQYEERPK